MREMSPLEARCTLAANGYSCIPVNGKIPHIRGWQQWHHRDAEVIRLWERGYSDHRNTSLLTRDNPFLDLDIYDEDAAEDAALLVSSKFDGSFLPLRIGKSPKRGLLFQLSGDPFAKITVDLIGPDGREHRIEFLSNGNQVVVHGTHPETLKPYTWHAGSPFDIKHDDLIGITHSDAAEIINDVVDMLARDHGFKIKRGEPRQNENGQNHGWGECLSHLNSHDHDTALSMKLLRAGMSDGSCVNFGRELIARFADDSNPERVERRINEWPAAVKSARAKIGDATGPKPDAGNIVSHTMAELEGEVFMPLKWVLPSYIPEGLTLVAGKPKSGKSWLMLALAFARTEGTSVLGQKCPQGEVLYCALEDNKRRMQSRSRVLLGTMSTGWPTGFHVTYNVNDLDHDGVGWLQRWIDSHPTVKLIIIDTLANFRGKKLKDEDQYQCDYRTMKALLDLGLKNAIDIIVVHHVRKQSAEDVFDTISGTLGLSAVADTLMVLTRAGDTLRLCTRGRDVEPEDKTVDFDPDAGEWTITGDFENEDNATSKTRDLIKAALTGAPSSMTPAQVAATVGLSVDNVRHAMRRMTKEGAIKRTSYGSYEVVS